MLGDETATVDRLGLQGPRPASTSTSSCSPPASGPATRWPAPPASTSPSAAASWSTSSAGPPTRTSGRSASAPRPAAGCTAWSPPATTMAEVVVDALLGGAGAFTGADMSTKLKLLGVDVARFGDAHATTEGASSWSTPTRSPASTRSWSSARTASQLLGGVLVGDATAYGVLRPMVARHGAAREPRGADPPAGRGGAEIGAARRRGRLLLQQRHQGATIVAAADDGGPATTPPASPSTRPAAPAAPASPLVEEDRRGLLRRQGQTVDTQPVRALPADPAELFDVVPIHGYTPFDQIVEAPRPRPRLRRLQAGGRLDPGQPAQRARARRRAPGRCRTPTTPTWPTSSATAPTRSCRGSPAARSPPRS